MYSLAKRPSFRGPKDLNEGGLILKVWLGWVGFSDVGFFGSFGLGGFVWMELDGR